MVRRPDASVNDAPDMLLVGSRLPGRWQGRERFVILQTDFGLGHRFLATWQAWRADPQHCARLFFIAVAPRPPTRDELIDAHRDSASPDLAEALQGAWPPITPDLHRLSFDAGQVQLLLAPGEAHAWLPELVTQADAFHLASAPNAGTPTVWNHRMCKALGRLAAPGATLTAQHLDAASPAHLVAAGFVVMPTVDTPGGPDVLSATFAPAFRPRRAAWRLRPPDSIEPHAVIIGGGLAGCAAAWALAEQGWRSTVLERHARIATEASGNPGGLFHGIVNAHDGVHARFNRGAALAAREVVQVAIDAHDVAGSARGLLRLESSLGVASMQALLQRLGLPPDYAEALDAATGGARAGIALSRPAWFYAGGGWVHPAGLARSFLERAGSLARVVHGVEAGALQSIESGWRVLDTQGRSVAEAPTVVLANAGDALRLLGGTDWPIEKVRGQISMLAAPNLACALPRMPIAGTGYLLPEIDGQAIFGATSAPGDLDPAVRISDHVANLEQLERLVGHALAVDAAALDGRTAWRFSSYDRLPVIGAVPDETALGRAPRLDQPRFVPRRPGLFVFTALGSRGITWSALGAQVVASLVTGAPVPLAAGLLDAIDPARFISRRSRRETAR
jgi:tRNA 5-methylaminomethyl-2-thiouridine biosynthesis bifunctional protein